MTEVTFRSNVQEQDFLVFLGPRYLLRSRGQKLHIQDFFRPLEQEFFLHYGRHLVTFSVDSPKSECVSYLPWYVLLFTSYSYDKKACNTAVHT